MAGTALGQRKPATENKPQHSVYQQLKKDFERKAPQAKEARTPDMMQIIRQRDQYRLLQVVNLMHWEGQYDTMSRTSYYYEGFSHLPAYTVEEHHDGSTFFPGTRIYYYFDAQDRDTMWVWQNYGGFRDWENAMRETWRYDSYGNEYLYLNDFWDISSAQWLLQFANRASHEYDSAGNVLSITYADYYNDQWFPFSRTIFEYDNDGRHTATVEQSWEEIDGKWVNMWREGYQLNAQNEWEVVKYYNWNDFDQQWELEGKATDITWLDFSQFKWLTVTLQIWDGQGWENDQRGACTYNANELLLTSTFEIWDGLAWENDFRERYEYDQYSFNTLEVMETWENGEWMIYNGQKINVDYDANANPVVMVAEFYDWGIGLWVISGKMLLTWETVTSLPEPLSLGMSLYPNPVTTQIHLKLNENLVDKAQFAIYNTSAQLMQSGRLNGLAIDVEQLPAGIYLLRLQHEGRTTTQKFIKR